jgi:uncharacterized protein (TIGR02246 family)
VGGTGPASEEIALRHWLAGYVADFNAHDAEKVAARWAENGVSVNDETGERTVGRAALQNEFAAFFEQNASAQLAGEVTDVRLIHPTVVTAEGQTTLSLDRAEPVTTAFTAVLVKQGTTWEISSSHERDLPAPATPSDALQDLEWLIGTWEDQTDGAQVTTSVRWSPNQAFLIRSFDAQFDEESAQGTQVIGWDPLSQQIRTWVFNSDGSFGQGTVSRHDDDWMIKMWQVLSDGRLASGTKVISRVDDDTITVQTIGETVDGEPLATAEPVTVIRTSTPDAVSAAEGVTP